MSGDSKSEAAHEGLAQRRPVKCAYCAKTFSNNFLRHMDIKHFGLPPAEVLHDEFDVPRKVYY